jgi:POT family proton-dependent oligopeptide transporter
VWMYAGLGITGFVAGCAFFVCFREGRKGEGSAVILEAVLVEMSVDGYQDGKSGLEKR